MPTAEWNFGLISEKRKMNKIKTPTFVGVFSLKYFENTALFVSSVSFNSI